ncbi:MAG: hypothetical protein JSW08_01070 [archaeon]|nr:MAG: hypothetical protein JSW08_01070 [archaeon]
MAEEKGLEGIVNAAVVFKGHKRRESIEEAAELYKEGTVNRIVIVGPGYETLGDGLKLRKEYQDIFKKYDLDPESVDYYIVRDRNDLKDKAPDADVEGSSKGLRKIEDQAYAARVLARQEKWGKTFVVAPDTYIYTKEGGDEERVPDGRVPLVFDRFFSDYKGDVNYNHITEKSKGFLSRRGWFEPIRRWCYEGMLSNVAKREELEKDKDYEDKPYKQDKQIWKGFKRKRNWFWRFLKWCFGWGG